MTRDEQLEAALRLTSMLLVRRVLSTNKWNLAPHLEDDLKQDLALFVIKAFRSYDPDKGKVNTWAGYVFNTWTRKHMAERREVENNETPFAPVADPLDDDGYRPTLEQMIEAFGVEPPEPAPFSELAESLVDRFPEALREAVRHVWGDGLNSVQAAAHIGITDTTVRRHLQRARDFIANNPDEFSLVAA